MKGIVSWIRALIPFGARSFFFGLSGIWRELDELMMLMWMGSLACFVKMVRCEDLVISRLSVFMTPALLQYTLSIILTDLTRSVHLAVTDQSLDFGSCMKENFTILI